jgi:hypothetical protein
VLLLDVFIAPPPEEEKMLETQVRCMSSALSTNFLSKSNEREIQLIQQRSGDILTVPYALLK